jgi:hypothetical protein
MSALPPEADMLTTGIDVRYVSEADIAKNWVRATATPIGRAP